jgi:hypothetical protein
MTPVTADPLRENAAARAAVDSVCRGNDSLIVGRGNSLHTPPYRASAFAKPNGRQVAPSLFIRNDAVEMLCRRSSAHRSASEERRGDEPLLHSETH